MTASDTLAWLEQVAARLEDLSHDEYFTDRQRDELSEASARVESTLAWESGRCV